MSESETSKTSVCADKVFKIWDETTDKRLTQMVFCDFSTPNKDGRFNIYDDIKDKLLKKGVPEHEIAFIHDYDSEAQKKELFAKVRSGKIRVLFGSTTKMGAGTNVQDKLIANHDVDCPWRPADLEQRAGRIVRRGNNNNEVLIFRYATQGTFDSYLWQTVEAKQRFISQIMTSKSPVRSCEDVDEVALSYAEIKALCAGNPLIAQKMNLDVEVAKLQLVKSDFLSQKHHLEDKLLQYYPKEIAAINERIAGIEKDITLYKKEKAGGVDIQKGIDGSVSVSANFNGMIINGEIYTEKEAAAKALLEACESVISNDEVDIGSYMGFQMSLRLDNYDKTVSLLLRGSMTYRIDLGTDSFGNITRINNVIEGLPVRLEGVKSQLDNMLVQQQAAEMELQKPFELADELAEKETQLALINSQLNINDNIKQDTFDMEENSALHEDFEPPDDDRCELSYQSKYETEHEKTPASAKSVRPSFLDGIRSYTFDKQQTDTVKKTQERVV